MINRVDMQEKVQKIEIPRLNICPYILHVDADAVYINNASVLKCSCAIKNANTKKKSYLLRNQQDEGASTTL